MADREDSTNQLVASMRVGTKITTIVLLILGMGFALCLHNHNQYDTTPIVHIYESLHNTNANQACYTIFSGTSGELQIPRDTVETFIMLEYSIQLGSIKSYQYDQETGILTIMYNDGTVYSQHILF